MGGRKSLAEAPVHCPKCKKKMDEIAQYTAETQEIELEYYCGACGIKFWGMLVRVDDSD